MVPVTGSDSGSGSGSGPLVQPPSAREPRRRHRGRESRPADNDRGGGHCIAVSTSNSVYTLAFSRRFRIARHSTARHGTARLVNSRDLVAVRWLFATLAPQRANPGRLAVRGSLPPRQRVHTRRRSVTAATFPPLSRPVTIPRRFRGRSVPPRNFRMPRDAKSDRGRSWSRRLKRRSRATLEYRSPGCLRLHSARYLSRSIDVLSFGASLGQ